jgi:hypothetical protein
MPIVKQVKGNFAEILQKEEMVLAVIVTNCQKTIENGIGEEIAEVYPQVIEVDNQFPLPALYRLGDYAVCGNILLFYTHLSPHETLELSALKSCLKKLSNEAIRSNSYIEIMFPMIEKNWEIIKRILNFQEHLLITVVEDDKGQVRVGKK